MYFKIAYGARKQVEIVRDEGSCEDEGKAYAVLFENVFGGKSLHVNADLLHSGYIFIGAHKAVLLAVDNGSTDDLVGLARPVYCVCVCELICR